MGVSSDSIFSSQSQMPVWMEFSVSICFALGFLLLRLALNARSKAKGGKQVRGKQVEVGVAKQSEASHVQLWKTVESEVAAGHTISAVKAWRRMKVQTATPLETLKLVTQALLDLGTSRLVEEIVEHVADHRRVLCNSRTAAALLDVVARTGRVNIMEELHRIFVDCFRIQPSPQTYEALLGGYAFAGNEKKAAAISSELRSRFSQVTPRGHSLMIKGFLKNGMVDAALRQILDMHRDSCIVPWLAVTQLVRAACVEGRGLEVFHALDKELSIPAEAIVLLLENCLKHGDLSHARHIEHTARQRGGSAPLLLGSYEALLKNCILHNDMYALELFEEMQKSCYIRINEGLCLGLLARCADSKFLRFAEEIVKYLRARGEMTIAVYSALMKVYAFVGMYDKACDLYDELLAKGMEPDAMMYGCLMKFAVECGRTDMSRQLFSKAPSVDIQNYMSLLKAAGHDKDIDRAFDVLQRLKASGVTPDVAAYSCALDVCVSAGDLSRARQLMAEIRMLGKLDIITYNTILKGYCSLGDMHGARDLLSEMESNGMPPNEVSFNCLINAAVSSNKWQEAWNTVELMQRRGVQADHYTVSIMLKALKGDKSSEHVGRVLALLDHSGLDVCSDEILMSTALEACIRHRYLRRLQNIVDAFSKSTLHPNIYTYGSLIKACGILKRMDKCWELWHNMVDDRALEPNNVVLGRMLDALACNKRAEEAEKLFKQWQPKVPANLIIYSTLIKAYANTGHASRAMVIYREMQDMKIPMNIMVFNGLIDSQVRGGAMEEVGLLLRAMADHNCTPDTITYSTVVKGYTFKGDLDRAFEVLKDMQLKGLATNSVVYNTLLDGCVRRNRMDLADILLDDMEKHGIRPCNVTLGILVKMHGRRGQLHRAVQAVQELPKKHGFVANASVKTCLMSACFYNHKLDLALNIFEELTASEEGSDWKIYASMIQGCIRNGWFQRAVSVIEDAYGLNPESKPKFFSPGKAFETQCLEHLLQSLTQQGKMKTLGVPLLNRLRAANVSIHGKTLTTFTSSQLAN